MPKNKTAKITIEELARMVAKGFEKTAKKIDIEKLETRINIIETRMNERFDNIDTSIFHLRKDVADIKERLTRLEYEDLPERVSSIEKKLGIRKN